MSAKRVTPCPGAVAREPGLVGAGRECVVADRVRDAAGAPRSAPRTRAAGRRPPPRPPGPARRRRARRRAPPRRSSARSSSHSRTASRRPAAASVMATRSGRCRQPAPQVAGDTPREGRVVAQQRVHESRPQERPRAVETLLLLEREPGHRDDGGHDAAALLVEVAGGHRDHAAQVPAAPEGLQREGRAGDPQRRRRAGAPAQHDADLGAQLLGDVGVERRRMLARQRARGVVHARPTRRAGAPARRASRRARRAAGRRARSPAARRAPSCAARRTAAAIASAFARATAMNGVRYGHLEQRHPRVAARGGQRRRDAVAHDLGAEARVRRRRGRTGAARTRGTSSGSSSAPWNCVPVVSSARPSDEERRGVGEVGAVHPADRAVERSVAEVGRLARPGAGADRVGRAGRAAWARRPSSPCGLRSMYATYGVLPPECTSRRVRPRHPPPTLATMSTTATDTLTASYPLGGPTLPQERRLVTEHPRSALAGADRPQGRRRRRGRRAHRADRRPSPPAAASSWTSTATRSSTSAPASPSPRSATRTRRSSPPCRRRSPSSPTPAS